MFQIPVIYISDCPEWLKDLANQKARMTEQASAVSIVKSYRDWPEIGNHPSRREKRDEK